MTSPYITEAVRRAKLPISVKAVPYKTFRLSNEPSLLKSDCCFTIRDIDNFDEFEPWDWREATRSYISLRTRLEQHHEPL